MSSLSKIGHSFPLVMKKQYVKGRLQRGVVISLEVPDVDHLKYFVFMGYDPETDEAWGFFISSPKKNPALAHKNLLVKDFQFTVKKKTHTFLKWDSVINCFSYEGFDFLEMVNGLLSDPQRICGDLSADMLEQVIEAAETNPAFPPYDRNVLTGPLALPNF